MYLFLLGLGIGMVLGFTVAAAIGAGISNDNLND